MATKKLYCIIFVFLIGVEAFAYDFIVNNIYYNYINEGKELEVTKPDFFHYSGSITIPEEVTYMNRTRKVTSIGKEVFRNSKITSIKIGNNITKIGDAAFSECINLTSITIGNGVTTIGEKAFSYCNSLPSITIGDNVKSIGERAFYHCNILSSITIGSGITSIGEGAFEECRVLKSVYITDLEAWCNINFCDIFSNPLCLAHHLFYNGSEIHDLVIPSSITNIGAYSFYYCIGLSSISIANSVTSIGESAFQACIGVSSLTIGSGVSNIGQGAFASADIPIVISLIENPFEIVNNTFSNNTFINATLYVPKGCIDKYKSTEGWKYFNYIEESSSNGTNETQKCEKPTISYSNGKLIFNSATEGVTFLSSITDTDINSYSTNEVLLGVTYEISVYATKVGYEDSETATATLCWIDVEPKTEGLNSIAQVKANAVMIKADGGLLTIEGAEDNTNISVYTIDGVQVGSTTSRNGIAHVNTNIIRDSIAIVKIGSRSVKVIMK